MISNNNTALNASDFFNETTETLTISQYNNTLRFLIQHKAAVFFFSHDT